MLKAKVISVAESSGVRERELAWEAPIKADPAKPWPEVAVEAAERWYQETDQCSEAHLVVRIVRADGQFTDFAVACAPRVVVSVREVETSDGCARGRAWVGGTDERSRVPDLESAVKLIATRCARAAVGQMEYPIERAARDLFEAVASERAA